MRILLTAFEPFDGDVRNSSLDTLEGIKTLYPQVILPVSYKRSKEELEKAIIKYQPDFILSLGQAGGDKEVRIEKIALNYTRASISDNDGVLLKKGKIIDGPLALESDLDVEELVDLVNSNVPCYLSLSAGGYICNTVYYYDLYKMKNRALFVHLPSFSEKTISKDEAIKAIEMVILYIEEYYAKN